MLEKRLPYFLIGLAAGAGVLALFAPKSGRETRRLITGQVHRGKELLAKSGTKVRRSAADLLSRGKGSLKHVNGAFKGAMEAGRTAFSVH
jgi:gas vesicle protein